MKAKITRDHLNDDRSDRGVTFQYGNVPLTRKFKAYDDDNELYYELTAELLDDGDLGDLLNQLAAYAGVTRLQDVTGDGDDWSAS